VTNYADLGAARVPVLSARAEISALSAYAKSIDAAALRLEVAQLALGRIDGIATETRSGLLGGGGGFGAGGQTQAQVGARASFGELVSLLNSEVAGRHLFAGRAIEQRPVAAADIILQGDGTRAGFAQVAAERRMADLGDGLGRLDIASPSADAISLSEDAASPFGFKLSSATSSLTGATVTGPAGAPASIEIGFGATPPQDGETISLRLALPDGSESVIALTARTGAGGPGEFAIGATPAETAANFGDALDAALRREAQTSLSAASAQAAGDDFFDADRADPPRRVDGPPFDTATALRDATPADTVLWYTGEDGSTPARASALARVGDDQYVAVGARANEDGLRETVKQLAILSVETFSASDPDATARYAALKSRSAEALGFASGGSPQSISGEFAIAQGTLNQAGERHAASAALLDNLVESHEAADLYDVSARLLALQTRMQASLQVTANLSQLSLVNYI
jgi:flagellar hook-associated protein 3 FlgL